ncbi:unnamed protein product [Absidia cylindrospora]
MNIFWSRRHRVNTRSTPHSIWTSPLLVSSYFGLYLLEEARSLVTYFCRHRRSTFTLLAIILSIWLVCKTEGHHQTTVNWVKQQFKWYGYWTTLGVASSVGLGSGLHTFVLFLGPYIAEVTVAAYKCQDNGAMIRNPSSYRLECSPFFMETNNISLTLWAIYQCIALETLAWGIGTALGELPPYFMARTVALSGGKNQAVTEFEISLTKLPQDRTLKEFISFYLYSGMKRLGFFGILVFASIPNPLFDLAGITCGHFLVPFTTFFGATLLGKACIKASIQALIVILTFSHETLTIFLDSLESSFPALHKALSKIILDHALQFGQSLSNEHGPSQMNYIKIVWNFFLSLMIGYFVISSIESLGLAYMKQQSEKRMERLQKHKKDK